MNRLIYIPIIMAVSLFVALGTVTGVSASQHESDVYKQICSKWADDDPDRPEVCKDNTASKDQKPSDNRIYGPNGILTSVVRLFLTAAAVIAVIMVIIGGFKYVLSTGDPAKINSAKNTILFAIIGLAVALMAQVIIVFVVNRVL